MPGIFSPDNIPAWMNPTRAILETDTSQVGANFASGFRQSREQQFRKDMIRDEQKSQLLNQVTMASKVAGIAEQLQGAQTTEAAWNVVAKNPAWLADPQTAPFIQNYLKAQTDVARAEINTLEGKTKIADLTDFTKRISSLDASDRAAIKSMTANPDGSVSAMQWQALGLAEQRLQAVRENQRKAAEVEALSRGDVPTTTITDKGVSTTFKPAPASDNATPQTMAIDGGVTLAWMPGGKSIHVINPKGEKNVLTPFQLKSIAEGLKRDDPRRTQINEFLANTAASQTVPQPAAAPAPSSAPEATPKILKYNPASRRLE